MMGGMNMPPTEAAGSMAPATWGLKPARFIKGMVKAPVETVLAMALPETEPKKPEANDRHLGRTAGGPAGQGQGQIQKKLAGARLFEKGAEKDKQDNVGHQHVGHDAEDAFLFQVDVVDDPFQGKTAMGDDVRHIGAEIAITDEKQADYGQGKAQHPAADFQGYQNAGQADQKIEGGFVAHAVVQGFEFHYPVTHHHRGQKGQADVQDGRPVVP